MVRVGRDVRLPEILQIMVVGGRTAPLDLRDDPSTGAETEEEVRSRLSHEPSLRSQHHLLAEPELDSEEEREVILNRLAPRSVDVDSGDLVAGRDDVIGQTDRESIDEIDLGGVLGRNDSLDVPPVALHELELRSPGAKKLVQRVPTSPPRGRQSQQAKIWGNRGPDLRFYRVEPRV